MLFVAIAALVIGYGVVYSGVQTLRGGPDARTGILECLTPGFDPVAKEAVIASSGKGSAEPTPAQMQTAGAFAGSYMAAQANAPKANAKAPAPMLPPAPQRPPQAGPGQAKYR